jgi:hypothetical protein
MKQNNCAKLHKKYWESRKKYGSVVMKKKAAWQTEEAERMNILVRHKDAKKYGKQSGLLLKK